MTFTNLKKVVQICYCLRFVWVRFSKKNVILSNKENFFRPEKRHLSHVLKREYIDRIICLCCYHQILISLWSFTILDPLKHFLFAKGLKNTFSLPLLIMQFLQQFFSRNDFLQADDSSQKRTNEFNFTTMILVFVRFLEEIEDIKKPFRNYLT